MIFFLGMDTEKVLPVSYCSFILHFVNKTFLERQEFKFFLTLII